eukprot:XP_014773890.1 PREDICTED: uncharacterized protein LOC106871765 [Octopus bimaculoides]
MFTSVDKKSDHKIHINLVVIIVVAAVIISVAIVISMAVCMIHKNNQRNIRCNEAINDPNKYFDERNPYDVPVAMVTDRGSHRHSQTTLQKSEPQSEYKSVHSLKGASSIKQSYNMAQRSHQESMMTSCIGKEKEHMFMVPDQFSEQISISSNVENGHGWIESDTVLYETLPAGI